MYDLVIGGDHLLILTLNLWNTNEPLHLRMTRLEEYLAQTRPDIIALQEISPINGIPQSDLLAKKLGYISHYIYSGTWYGREQGLAILTLANSRVDRVISLTNVPEDMQRVAAAAVIPASQSMPELVVINTHLAYPINQTTSRLSQMKECLRMAEEIAHEGTRSVVLCGDLNEHAGGAVTESIEKDSDLKLLDCWLAFHPESEIGHTFACGNPWADDKLWPGRRIDYIFISSQTLQPCACDLVLTDKDGWGPVSDHYGVLTQVEAR